MPFQARDGHGNFVTHRVPRAVSCSECSVEFLAVTSTARFCSVRCRGRAWERTHLRPTRQVACAECGVTFSASSGPAAYCSRLCKRRAAYRRDPSKILRHNASWRKKNRYKMNAWIAAWTRRHPETRQVKNARRNALIRGAGGSFTRTEWENVKVFWANTCAYCGMSGKKLEADHSIPLSRGGSNDISNIIPACRPCNLSKGSRTEEEYRAAWITEIRAA